MYKYDDTRIKVFRDQCFYFSFPVNSGNFCDLSAPSSLSRNAANQTQALFSFHYCMCLSASIFGESKSSFTTQAVSMLTFGLRLFVFVFTTYLAVVHYLLPASNVNFYYYCTISEWGGITIWAAIFASPLWKQHSQQPLQRPNKSFADWQIQYERHVLLYAQLLVYNSARVQWNQPDELFRKHYLDLWIPSQGGSVCGVTSANPLMCVWMVCWGPTSVADADTLNCKLAWQPRQVNVFPFRRTQWNTTERVCVTPRARGHQEEQQSFSVWTFQGFSFASPFSKT